MSSNGEEARKAPERKKQRSRQRSRQKSPRLRTPSGLSGFFKPTHGFFGNLVDEKKQNPYDRYKQLDVIGEGSISTVYKVKAKRHVNTLLSPTNEDPVGRDGGFLSCFKRKFKISKSKERPSSESLFAIKEISLERIDKSTVNELLNEIEILKELDHPNIVRQYEFFQHDNTISVVMELCTGGDLYAREPYKEPMARGILRKILRAIQYLHELDIAHRDLKFENILFESDALATEIKLIDFGLAKKFLDRGEAQPSGTLYTVAPEVLKGAGFTVQADMWSIGVIAYMLLSGKKPFQGVTMQQMMQNIVQCKLNFNTQHWTNVSMEAKKFVASLLKIDPTKRLTAKQALRTAWLRKELSTLIFMPKESEFKKAYKGIVAFSGLSKLKKLALLIIAYKSSAGDIKDLRRMFKCINESNSGCLSFEEFQKAFCMYSDSDEELHMMYEACDLFDDKRIQYSEFLAATISTLTKISEDKIADAFLCLDNEEKGFISKKNLRDILGKNYTEELVDVLSGEGEDGKISYEDFLKEFRQSKTLPRVESGTGLVRRPSWNGLKSLQKGSPQKASPRKNAEKTESEKSAEKQWPRTHFEKTESLDNDEPLSF